MTRIVQSKRSNSTRSLYLFAVLLYLFSLFIYSQSLPLQSASLNAAGQSKIVAKTELVVLPVSVTDAKGNFISGLGLLNFHVYEDGRLQRVTSFQEGDTPVTVGLIVDHSRSMGPKLQEVGAAVFAFARSSNLQDEMFVVDFNDGVSVEPLNGKPFTNDAKLLERAVSAVSARGRTALYDAVAEGLNHLQLGHLDKRALIIISDGGDNASKHKYSQVLDLAQRHQVTIYAIGLVDSNEEENPTVLRRLCKETGGIAYFPHPSENVTDISKQIARDLRDQYTLGFPPENANIAHPFRKIEVKVTVPGLGKTHARTRSGYFSADEKSSAAEATRGAK